MGSLVRPCHSIRWQVAASQETGRPRARLLCFERASCNRGWLIEYECECKSAAADPPTWCLYMRRRLAVQASLLTSCCSQSHNPLIDWGMMRACACVCVRVHSRGHCGKCRQKIHRTSPNHHRQRGSPPGLFGLVDACNKTCNQRTTASNLHAKQINQSVRRLVLCWLAEAGILIRVVQRDQIQIRPAWTHSRPHVENGLVCLSLARMSSGRRSHRFHPSPPRATWLTECSLSPAFPAIRRAECLFLVRERTRLTWPAPSTHPHPHTHFQVPFVAAATSSHATFVGFRVRSALVVQVAPCVCVCVCVFPSRTGRLTRNDACLLARVAFPLSTERQTGQTDSKQARETRFVHCLALRESSGVLSAFENVLGRNEIEGRMLGQLAVPEQASCCQLTCCCLFTSAAQWIGCFLFAGCCG